MLKVYSIEWIQPWGAPYTVHTPPNPSILSVTMVQELRHIFDVYGQPIDKRMFRGFVAAVSLEAAITAVRQDFMWAEPTHINLMIPPILYEYFGPVPHWSPARFHYYNQTRQLLPAAIANQRSNDIGWNAVTKFEHVPPPMHHCVELGIKYPYDNRDLPLSTERALVLGVLADLSDRRGIKWELAGVDQDVREEMVDSLAVLVTSVLNN